MKRTKSSGKTSDESISFGSEASSNTSEETLTNNEPSAYEKAISRYEDDLEEVTGNYIDSDDDSSKFKSPRSIIEQPSKAIEGLKLGTSCLLRSVSFQQRVSSVPYLPTLNEDQQEAYGLKAILERSQTSVSHLAKLTRPSTTTQNGRC